MKRNELFHNQLKTVSPVIRQEMEWSSAIVDKIDSLLKEKNMTQRELAGIIGCSEAQITRWTRGFPNYTINSLAKLSKALGEPLINI